MPRLLRLSVATRCFNRPLKLALISASEAGAAGVQLDVRNELRPSDISATGRRDLLHSLDELGLKIENLDFPIRHSLNDSNRLEERIDALKQAMNFASELGAKTVSVRVAEIPGESDAPSRALLKGLLDDLSRHGNRHGVTLALTPSRDTEERVVNLVSEITQGPLGINFDPASAVANGRIATESLAAMAPFVVHAMGRDAVRDTSGTGSEVAIGRGDVVWDELLAMLYETDYRGWLAVDRTQGEDRADDARRGVEFLKSISLGA